MHAQSDTAAKSVVRANTKNCKSSLYSQIANRIKTYVIFQTIILINSDKIPTKSFFSNFKSPDCFAKMTSAPGLASTAPAPAATAPRQVVRKAETKRSKVPEVVGNFHCCFMKVVTLITVEVKQVYIPTPFVSFGFLCKFLCIQRATADMLFRISWKISGVYHQQQSSASNTVIIAFHVSDRFFTLQESG